MSDLESAACLHQAAMECAEKTFFTQDPEEAKLLFRQALELERRAAEIWIEIRNQEPTRSVLLRSAASLAWSCQDYAEAERLAKSGLEGMPPGMIAQELEELLEKVQRTTSQSDV